MVLQKRHSMNRSSSADIQQVWADSSTAHIAADEIIIRYHSSIRHASKELKKEQK